MRSAASFDESVSLDLSIGRHRSPDVASPRGSLGDEMNRLSEENKRLLENLSTMHINYNTLCYYIFDLMSPKISEEGHITPQSKKRKSESVKISSYRESPNNTIDGSDLRIESTSNQDSCMRNMKEDPKAKVCRACVRTDPSNSSLVVKDGYQWRKYGQKVTRNNPFPRAYFKCSFAPSCPVKKKVQRSVEDKAMLVATYTGEHNHDHSYRIEAVQNYSSKIGSFPYSVSINPSGPMITLDLTEQGSSQPELEKYCRDIDSPEIRKLLQEQMLSTLIENQCFTNVLATAISGRALQVPSAQN